MDSINDQVLRQLLQPFPSSEIQWRVGAMNPERTRGEALPYIDARMVQNRLDDTVGPSNWSVEFRPSPLPNGLVCRIGIRIGDTWVYKEDGAQLDRADANDENARERAIKGAYSDALKRAAVMWGIGRYLYAFRAPIVDLEMRGRRAVMVSRPTLPPEFLPQSEVDAQAQSDAQPSARATPAKSSEKEQAKAPANETRREAPARASAQRTETAPRAGQANAAKQATSERAASDTQDTRAQPQEREQQRPQTEQPARSAQRPAQANEAREASTQRTEAEATRRAAAAESSQRGAEPEMPENLPEAEQKLLNGLLEKIAKPSIPLTMLENYIAGPKVADVISEPSKEFLNAKLAARRAQEAAQQPEAETA